MRWVILGAAVGLFLGINTAYAQLPEVATARLEVDFSELNTLWFQALEYLDAGQWVEANLKLKELNEQKIRFGFQNLPTYSSVLIDKVKALRSSLPPADALKFVESAQLLSPDAAPVYFALARVRFSQNFTDVYGIAKNVLQGVILTCTDISTIIIAANKLLLTVLWAGVIASALFILFSFFYYRRAIFYQIKEAFPMQIPTVIAHVVGWLLIAIVTLGVGIFWGFLVLALFLIWHVDRASKRLLQGILVFGAVLAILLIALGVTFSTFESQYFQALRDLSHGGFSSRSVAALQQRLAAHPDDPYAFFGLGYIAQKLDKVDEAIEAYSLMPSPYPDWAAVQNNLGNLYQQQFRATKQPEWYQLAEEAYRSAIRYAPDMFEPRYNFGQLLLLQFAEGGEVDTQLSKAQEIDSTRFTLYSNYLGDDLVTVDASFSTIVLLKKLYAPDFVQDGTRLSQIFWASGSRFANPWYFSIAAGLLFLLSLFLGAKQGTPKHGVLYCQMCGDPYVMTRKKGEEQQTYCTQCTYIFKKKTVVKPEKRATKVGQIQLRQRLRGLFSKLASLLFPGAGQIYFGYPVKGFLLALVFHLACGFLVLKVFRVFLNSGGPLGMSWTVGMFVALAVGIVVY
ncbi:hypothetical protein GF339_10660, partial [candidate division KSB3 bacterium]|nr:hypothetical protein [candidate division KSB3 bacterium]MBD3325037.1 hypothetical protein [candidate division KSB3 bacterium]